LTEGLAPSDGQILLLYAYAKNVTENITEAQLQKLSALVRKELV